MRFVGTYASRIFIGTLAVLMALLVSTPKDPEAATHHSRTIRSGAQRIDSTEAADHSFEDPHPVLDRISNDSPNTTIDTGFTPLAARCELILLLAPPAPESDR